MWNMWEHVVLMNSIFFNAGLPITISITSLIYAEILSYQMVKISI